jgi:putative serine protease PepD
MTTHARHAATRHRGGHWLPYRAGRRLPRGAAVSAAGLGVALVSSGIGAAAALATQTDHSGYPTIATAAAATSQSAGLSVGPIEKVAAKVLPSVVELQTDAGNQVDEGSGIVLTADGLIMTNAHVVSAAASAGPQAHTLVTLSDGRTAPFVVIASDPGSDIAVVRAQRTSGLTPITVGSSGSLRVGQQVVAVGSPLGLDGTVTTGIVSALDRPISAVAGAANQPAAADAIQTDAAMNPGNSGGALVNMNGELVGMNSAIATIGSSGTQSGSIGLGFAIPVDKAKRIADELIATGQASNAALGTQTAGEPANGTAASQR